MTVKKSCVTTSVVTDQYSLKMRWADIFEQFNIPLDAGVWTSGDDPEYQGDEIEITWKDVRESGGWSWR